MIAPALIEVIEVTADPFTAVRALNRMRTAGFGLSLDAGRLLVKPVSRLTEPQRAFIRAHKPALVALLMDADTVYSALVQAGTAGLGWMEGTPYDWDNARLLAADEVLYAAGRIVTRNDRHYLRELAPPPNDAHGENSP